MRDDSQGRSSEPRSLRSAAVERRALALFRAMSTDFLLREQFVTDPAQVWSEYVYGAGLPPEKASVVNQFVYAIMANPGLVRWLYAYVSDRRTRPSQEEFMLHFGRAVIENDGRHVLYALTRSAVEKQALIPIDESILDWLFGIAVIPQLPAETERPGTRGTFGATEGTFEGTRGTFGGTEGGTQGTFGGTRGTFGGTEGGTEGTFGGTRGTFGGTEGGTRGTFGGTEGGTRGTFGGTEGTFGGTRGTFGGTEGTFGGTEGTFGGTQGTFGGTQTGTAQTFGTFGHGTGMVTEQSTGTGGTQMSTGTGGTQMSTGGPTPTPPAPAPTPPTPPTPTPPTPAPTPTPPSPAPTPTPPTPTPTPPTPTPPNPPPPEPPDGPPYLKPPFMGPPSPIFPPLPPFPITSVHPGYGVLNQPDVRAIVEALMQYAAQLRGSGALDSVGMGR